MSSAVIALSLLCCITGRSLPDRERFQSYFYKGYMDLFHSSHCYLRRALLLLRSTVYLYSTVSACFFLDQKVVMKNQEVLIRVSWWSGSHGVLSAQQGFSLCWWFWCWLFCSIIDGNAIHCSAKKVLLYKDISKQRTCSKYITRMHFFLLTILLLEWPKSSDNFRVITWSQYFADGFLSFRFGMAISKDDVF